MVDRIKPMADDQTVNQYAGERFMEAVGILLDCAFDHPEDGHNTALLRMQVSNAKTGTDVEVDLEITLISKTVDGVVTHHGLAQGDYGEETKQ